MERWERWNAWTLTAALSESVLDELPEPESFAPETARRVLVLLGLAGA